MKKKSFTLARRHCGGRDRNGTVRYIKRQLHRQTRRAVKQAIHAGREVMPVVALTSAWDLD